ncbi:MAG TPA: hypothetical protein PKG56_04430 [Chitinophagaceae bacterium]|nr:hypothetical protein [Chitinophagaceae bacterium]HMZ45464.1 hypothetical protein [Chitinophagaceae bacterium]HNE94104.1 hypothetical protein [Chitinophagaceae bacterium]HNF30665.1 hypothetical protein [Chitinophagaceae bacterium]HNL82616.1 hypothetical protein [Chitinophagaceae bacterium]
MKKIIIVLLMFLYSCNQNNENVSLLEDVYSIPSYMRYAASSNFSENTDAEHNYKLLDTLKWMHESKLQTWNSKKMWFVLKKEMSDTLLKTKQENVVSFAKAYKALVLLKYTDLLQQQDDEAIQEMKDCLEQLIAWQYGGYHIYYATIISLKNHIPNKELKGYINESLAIENPLFTVHVRDADTDDEKAVSSLLGTNKLISNIQKMKLYKEKLAIL